MDLGTSFPKTGSVCACVRACTSKVARSLGSTGSYLQLLAISLLTVIIMYLENVKACNHKPLVKVIVDS